MLSKVFSTKSLLGKHSDARVLECLDVLNHLFAKQKGFVQAVPKQHLTEDNDRSNKVSIHELEVGQTTASIHSNRAIRHHNAARFVIRLNPTIRFLIPHRQVRVVRFYQRCVLPLLLPPCQLLIAVGTARPQLGALDRSAKSRSQWAPVGTAGPQLAKSRSQLALLDLNRRSPDRRTSTAGKKGRLQDRMLEYLPDRMPEYTSDSIS